MSDNIPTQFDTRSSSTRATKACLSCRTRKVRCDASHSGVPCTNCRLDAKECLVAERKSRRQLPSLDKTSLPAVDRQTMNVTVEADPATQPHETFQQQQINFNNSPDFTAFEHMNTTSFNAHIYNNIYTASREPASITAETPRPITESHICYQDFRKYGFIKLSNMDSLSPEDSNYLYAQRCFHLPSKLLLDELIRLYLFHVHPLLPVLDDQSFWSSYFQQSEKGDVCNNQIPLLLLWSVLCASSGLLSPASAKSLGYVNVRNARAGFYRKAKILFDIESESSSVVLGQSTLLLSFQTFTPRFHIAEVNNTNMGSNTIWLGTAIQHAQQANAETICESPLVTTTASSMVGSAVLIRLWWCCIILDRLIALGQRRDLLIPQQYPLPSYTWFEDDIPWSRAQTTEIKQHFTVRFMHTLKLCMAATDMLLLDSHPQQLKAKTPSQLREAMVILEENGRSLERWHRATTLDIPELGDYQDTHTCFQHPSLGAYTRTLRISFSAAKLCAGHQELLLRSIITATGDETLSAQLDLSRVGQDIRNAISEISDCIIEFMQLGLIPHLYIGVQVPLQTIKNTLLTQVASASFASLPYLMQILDLKIARQSSPDAQLTDQYHRLSLLTEAVKEYQARYDGLDSFGSTIQFIITNFQLFTQDMPESVRISGWQDVLVHNPSCYMRLALTLEHCARTATIPTVQQLTGDLEESWTIPMLQSLDLK